MNPESKNIIISSLLGLVSGLVFLLLLWAYLANTGNSVLSVGFVVSIHQTSPLWLFMDAIPVFTSLIGFLIGYQYVKKMQLLKITVQRQNDAMRKIGSFVEKIGQGDFNTEFRNGHDTIGNALIRMRDNLRKTALDEEERQWKMEGMNAVAEILRSFNDLSELGYHLIMFLVKKSNSIQGAFYTIEEDGKGMAVIRMKSSYAYNRKKYLKREFKIGEGLVGQSAIERDFIHRTEIPDDYFTVTSGILGDQKPRSLLIVPCISNDNLYGLIEIASLNYFKKLEIEFIREVSKVIGQTIFNLGVNERTAKLLDEVNKSQKKLHALLENASEFITIYDENDIVRYESPSVKHILGYTPEEMVGAHAGQRVHTKGMEELKNMLQELKENPNNPITIQIGYYRKDRSRIWLESTGKNLLHDPAIRGIIVNSRDITERRKAEKEQRLRGQMQSLSENSPDLILRMGIDGHIFYINSVVESLIGGPVEQYLGKPFSETGFPGEVKEEWEKLIDTISLENKKNSRIIAFPSINGEKIMKVNAIPEFNEKKLETILIVAHDITEQKKNEDQIREQNKDITDSIQYAQRIQSSLIPTESIIKKYFPNSFVFYKPKDIVSGDFPWLYACRDEVYISTVDCTGHGVPGALMSFIGYFTLNQILSSEKNPTAGETLDQLHESIQRTLKQDSTACKSTNDGMDIALCRINFDKKEIHFAGAHRPLYHLRHEESRAVLTEIKGDRCPIGGMHYNKTRGKFRNNTIHYKSGESIFFFTDGLPDQFGGPLGKSKFMSKKVQEIILANHHLEMDDFGILFQKEFEKWQGKFRQIDDVLLIGIKF